MLTSEPAGESWPAGTTTESSGYDFGCGSAISVCPNCVPRFEICAPYRNANALCNAGGGKPTTPLGNPDTGGGKE